MTIKQTTTPRHYKVILWNDKEKRDLSHALQDLLEKHLDEIRDSEFLFIADTLTALQVGRSFELLRYDVATFERIVEEYELTDLECDLTLEMAWIEACED